MPLGEPTFAVLSVKPEQPRRLMEINKTKDTVLNGIVRHVLTAAGGALVARGYIAETELELVVGAVVTLAGVIWSAIAKRKAAK